MKKLITILAAVALTAVSFKAEATKKIKYVTIGAADVNACLTGTAGTAFDTSATSADTLVYCVEIKGAKSVNTWHLFVDKISGTVAGSVTLQGAINYNGGSPTWYNLSSLRYKTLQSDTLTNADQDFFYPLQHSDYRFFVLTIITSGNPVVRTQPWVLARE